MFESLRDSKRNALIPRSKRYAWISSDTTLKITQQVVEVDTSGGAVTVTMPNVEEAAGLGFDIHAPNGSSDAVTVNDATGTSILDKGSTNTLDADDDYVTLVSTGQRWRHVDYTYD